MSEPCDLSARAVLSGFASKELSPVEVVRSCIDRINALNPVVNAVVALDEKKVLEDARFAEQQIMSGDTRGLLHGLPVAIKDLQATEGLTTTYGTDFFRDHVPNRDDGIVARIRSAGGIILCKTNIPEMSIGANTINRLFGATGNPYSPDLTCGGSSGGSAVAVATGMAPLATGSDHGGSLRIPASFCGVIGHRATPGVVPHEGRTITQTNYSLQGPMARNVDDVALLLAVIATRDNSSRFDPMSFPLDAHDFVALDHLGLSGLEIGVTADFGGLLVSEETRSEFRKRIDFLDDAGARIRPIDIDLTSAVDADWHLRADIFATQYHRDIDAFDDTFNPNVFRSYETALNSTVLEIAKARRQQVDLFRSFAAVFDDVDVVLCPGVSVQPFPWSNLHPVEIDGRSVENYMAWLGLTSSLTVVGHPVTAIPGGADGNGLPFGLQCVGEMYKDRRLLSISRTLDQAFRSASNFRFEAPDIQRLLGLDPQCAELGKVAAVRAAQEGLEG